MAQLPGLKEYLEDPNCLEKSRTFNNKCAKINNIPGSKDYTYGKLIEKLLDEDKAKQGDPMDSGLREIMKNVEKLKSEVDE